MMENNGIAIISDINQTEPIQQIQVNQYKNDHNNIGDESDGEWLLITSTMGLTLGYVRIGLFSFIY